MKSWFFEKTYKTGKPLTKLKKEKTQITRSYLENYYLLKLENIKRVGKFLNACDLQN